MEYKIRQAKIDDAIYLDELLTELIHDERKYDIGINPNFEVKNFYKNIVNKNDRHILVAEKNNNIIGYIYGFVVNPTTDYNLKVFKIDALYISEEYRNLHIASSLMEEVKKIAKEQKVDFIEVNVLNENTKAYNLYKKENFKETKTTLTYEI